MRTLPNSCWMGGAPRLIIRRVTLLLLVRKRVTPILPAWLPSARRGGVVCRMKVLPCDLKLYEAAHPSEFAQESLQKG